MPIQSVLTNKSLGVLMHPSCIPGGKVCGTFGKGAKEWIKKLHEHGIEYWQFLPLTPTGLVRIHGLKIMQHLLLLGKNLICCLGGNGLKNLK